MKTQARQRVHHQGSTTLATIVSLVPLVVVLLWEAIVWADSVPYGRKVNLSVENEQVALRHHHDWSQRWTRYKEDVFSPDNDYSYLELVDKSSGRVLFRRPVPALTFLWLSPDSRYVVGLSNIKLANLYQLVVFDTRGELIHKQHVTAHADVCLTLEEYDVLRRQYTREFEQIDEKIVQGIVIDSNWVYMYVRYSPLEALVGHLLGELDKHRRCPRFSHRIMESVTNWVFWFNEAHPEPMIEYQDTAPIAILLYDKAGERFRIPFRALAAQK